MKLMEKKEEEAKKEKAATEQPEPSKTPTKGNPE